MNIHYTLKINYTRESLESKNNTATRRNEINIEKCCDEARWRTWMLYYKKGNKWSEVNLKLRENDDSSNNAFRKKKKKHFNLISINKNHFRFCGFPRNNYSIIIILVDERNRVLKAPIIFLLQLTTTAKIIITAIINKYVGRTIYMFIL